MDKAEQLIADGGYGHTSSIYINTVTEQEKLNIDNAYEEYIEENILNTKNVVFAETNTDSEYVNTVSELKTTDLLGSATLYEQKMSSLLNGDSGKAFQQDPSGFFHPMEILRHMHVKPGCAFLFPLHRNVS